MAGLLSLASLRPRQSPEFPEYLTVVTEPVTVCRKYADRLGDVSFRFYSNPPVNITCWTDSSMLYDEKGRYEDSSWMWAWVRVDPVEYPEPDGELGIGNVEQGGVAGGYGCWMHEDDMQLEEDLYLPDEIQWCGDAPQHQVCLASPAHSLGKGKLSPGPRLTTTVRWDLRQRTLSFLRVATAPTWTTLPARPRTQRTSPASPTLGAGSTARRSTGTAPGSLSSSRRWKIASSRLISLIQTRGTV